VAAELSAASRRQTIRQLANWYEDGWAWYGVRCRFTVLGDEFEASLWGIDDAEYAERDIKVEMALDVAGQLEKAGFTVTGGATVILAMGAGRKAAASINDYLTNGIWEH